MATYKIMRYYKGNRKPRTIKKGLTLEQAKRHCRDPKTEKKGIYFDGYTKEG